MKKYFHLKNITNNPLAIIPSAPAVVFPVLQQVSTLSVSQLIIYIITIMLMIAGGIAVIYLIYGGILYITAGGDAEKAQAGKTAMINAIIGVAIIILSYIIVAWVQNLLSAGTM